MSTFNELYCGDRGDVPDLLRSLADYPFSFPSFDDTVKEAAVGISQGHRPGVLGGCRETMPGKAALNVAVQPGGTVTKAAPQKSFPFVLKKIMDIPPPNILEEGDDEIEKEKLCSSDDVEASGDGSSAGGGSRGGGGGGGGGGGVSASLTPAIWEKTIPYDGETFHLEYMDLDEFLLENGIPVSLEEEELQKTLSSTESKGKSILKVTTTTPPTAPPAPAEASASSPTSSTVTSETEEPLTVTTLQPAKLEEDDEEEEGGQEEEALCEEAMAEEEEEEEEEEEKEKEVKPKKTDRSPADRNTPSPIDPEAIEVDINFQPDPTDLVLSSVPGGELFNPRKHKFSDEELKPQPMIKKAKKVFVPDEQKDEKYWSRRKKNNMAAKRSRDARRLKENQITVRASFLERENAALRQQVAELRKDCGRCKNILARYEAKYGPL
ncbi:TEF transcription factor, PAR bZIP family member b isoform X1 [Cheilinus undulatus]|uniref:TEF transcription factor, PAR bZIP family member b isoform X1 n=1 Tax=Cheilinus undulatus TaxID=241271 RepID=UPI001BD1D442|nr:TEF transcription factor, PAR bZIP family member b isoform X1 [Cheilinus undulatus]